MKLVGKGFLVADGKIEESTTGLTPKPHSTKLEPKVKKSSSRRVLFIVGSLVAVIILGLFGSAIVSRSNANNDPMDPRKVEGKVALSERQLHDVVIAKQLTVYWAGPVPGDKYSLVAKEAGQSFVRYLPGGLGLSDSGNTFRIIGTYSQKGAFLTTQSAGTQLGNVGFTNIDANSVFYSKARPRDVYMGIKDKDIQLEIFDPGIDQALGLSLLHGQIQQIG